LYQCCLYMHIFTYSFICLQFEKYCGSRRLSCHWITLPLIFGSVSSLSKPCSSMHFILRYVAHWKRNAHCGSQLKPHSGVLLCQIEYSHNKIETLLRVVMFFQYQFWNFFCKRSDCLSSINQPLRWPSSHNFMITWHMLINSCILEIWRLFKMATNVNTVMVNFSVVPTPLSWRAKWLGTL